MYGRIDDLLYEDEDDVVTLHNWIWNCMEIKMENWNENMEISIQLQKALVYIAQYVWQRPELSLQRWTEVICLSFAGSSIFHRILTSDRKNTAIYIVPGVCWNFYCPRCGSATYAYDALCHRYSSIQHSRWQTFISLYFYQTIVGNLYSGTTSHHSTPKQPPWTDKKEERVVGSRIPIGYLFLHDHLMNIKSF